MLRSARAAFGALFFVAAAVSVPAQRLPQAPTPTPVPAPAAVLQSFDVMAGTVQDLAVPVAPPADVVIDVVLGAQLVRLDLHRFDVRAPGFQLIERGAGGEVVLPTPTCTTFRGGVLGEVDSAIAASLDQGSLRAWIRRSGGELWLVQAVREVQPAAPLAAHLVYRGSDSANLPQHCGLTGVAPANVPMPPGIDVAYGCQLAVEADYPFFQANGSSTTATQNDVTAVVNAMDVIYRRDVQVALQLSTLVVDSAPDAYTSSSPGTLLPQFAGNWNANQGSIVRDCAHLFTGRPMGATSGGVIGLAYVGVVCNVGSAYGVSESRFTSNWNFRVAVTAHEIGHNFNAQHCDASSPCNIMCSGVGGCSNNQSSFGPTEQAQIVAYRQGVGCLQQISTAPVITGITQNTVETFRPVLLTLTGTGFTGTTGISVSGHAVTTAISVLSDTQIRFTPPAGLSLGLQILTVTNPSGTSNGLVLFYTGADPCGLNVPSVALGGTTLTWQMGGWPADMGFLILSLANTTSLFQGELLLDGFSVIWVGGLDARGMASYSIPVPAGVLSGVRVYSQLVDVSSPTALRSTSPVATTLVLL